MNLVSGPSVKFEVAGTGNGVGATFAQRLADILALHACKLLSVALNEPAEAS
jgi:hypothetical protein